MKICCRNSSYSISKHTLAEIGCSKQSYLIYTGKNYVGLLYCPRPALAEAKQFRNDRTALMQTELGEPPQNSVLMNRIHSIKSGYAACFEPADAQYDSSLVASASES